MNNWKKNIPNVDGFYWIHQHEEHKEIRMVKVWELHGRFFTNEDGGAAVDDDIYEGTFWYGPIVAPDFEYHEDFSE